jgi:hypothetical protein
VPDGSTHWTTRKLAKVLGVSHMRVARAGRGSGSSRIAWSAMCSIDEKTAIQALCRTGSAQRPSHGQDGGQRVSGVVLRSRSVARANATAWARFLTPACRYNLCKCVRTVGTEIPRRSATSLSEAPIATRFIISNGRGERTAQESESRDRLIVRSATFGSDYEGGIRMRGAVQSRGCSS